MPTIALFFVHFFLVYKHFCRKQLYKPKLVNSKSGDHHDFPLGVLEATGRLQDGDREILIMDVGKGGRLNFWLTSWRPYNEDRKYNPDKFSKKTDAGLSGPQDLLGRSLDQKPGHPNRKWC